MHPEHSIMRLLITEIEKFAQEGQWQEIIDLTGKNFELNREETGIQEVNLQPSHPSRITLRGHIPAPPQSRVTCCSFLPFFRQRNSNEDNNTEVVKLLNGLAGEITEICLPPTVQQQMNNV